MIKSLGIVFEILALIVSLIVIKKNKGAFIQWMCPYLAYTVGTEMAAYYVYYSLHQSTSHLYVWHNVIETLFYTYIFQQLFKQLKVAKYAGVITWIISSVFMFLFIFIFFFTSRHVENSYRLQIISYFYFCILAAFYLYEEFANDSLDEFLIKKSGFWIAAGTLLFNSGISVVYALHPTTSKNNILIFGLPIHLFFAIILSVILYTCFSIAMIVWKNPSKTKQE